MNPYSYCIPRLSTVQPVGNAFAIMLYSNGYSAAIACEKMQRFIKLGFPLESMKDTDQLDQLLAAFMAFLRK